MFSEEEDFHQNKHLKRRNNKTIVGAARAVNPENRVQCKPKFAPKAILVSFIGSYGTAFRSVSLNGTWDGPKYNPNLIRKVDNTYTN